MPRLAAAVLAATLVWLGPPATASDDPGLHLTETRREYVVDATSPRALRQQMRQALARHVDGGGGVGRSLQTLSSRYELEPIEGGCRLKDLVVSLEVTIYLPRWEPAGHYLPGLEARWLAMHEALEAHELGHRDIAVETARGLLAELRALPPQPDCTSLETQARKRFVRAQMRHAIRDRAYEHRTRNGAAQGVKL